MVNQRLTWLLGAQAFLFAGFASVLSATKDTLDAPLKPWALSGFCVIGWGLAFAVYSGVRAAFHSLRALRNSWNTFNEQTEANRDKVAGALLKQGFPQLTWHGTEVRYRAGQTASLFPCLMMCAWGALAVVAVWKFDFMPTAWRRVVADAIFWFVLLSAGFLHWRMVRQ